jgi:DNA-binding GntR family transcriptional regulator
MNQPEKRSSHGAVLSNRVRQQISELIHNRTLAGGHVIIEQRIAEQLGVSRTPLREALQRLEGEGMIEKSSGRSYMVRKVDFQEYLQSFKVRLMLEPEAAALAAGRTPIQKLRAVRAEIKALRQLPFEHTKRHWHSDDELHRLISAQCGNMVLSRMIEQLRVTTRLYEIEDVRQRVDKDLAQHMAIIEAIAAEDEALARKAMRVHIRSLISHSIRQLG